MKIKMLFIALASSAMMCTTASGFDLLDRMLCRSGCGTTSSCCGTPVQSSCCKTKPCGVRMFRPMIARGCVSDCGGCETKSCASACDTGCGKGFQFGRRCASPCAGTRLIDMDFSLNLQCLLPKFKHCGGCDTGCNTGCNTGCDPCGRTFVRRPMMLGCKSSCNTGCDTGCDTGCAPKMRCRTLRMPRCKPACNTGCAQTCDTGCNSGCAPRVGLLDRIRCFTPRRACCDTGCNSGCGSNAGGCGQQPAPVEMQKVEPTPEVKEGGQTRYPSAPVVDPNAFIVPNSHVVGR